MRYHLAKSNFNLLFSFSSCLTLSLSIAVTIQSAFQTFNCILAGLVTPLRLFAPFTMAHLYPPLNRYQRPNQLGAGMATKSIPEDGVFEGPIAKTVPIGWKGKSSSKQEYATSTQNEEFWKAFSFGENDPEAAEKENPSLEAGNQHRDNRVDESESLDGGLTETVTADAEGLEQNENSLLS